MNISPLQILTLIGVIIGINAYFIPAYTGWWRKKRLGASFFLANLFLRWTVIG